MANSLLRIKNVEVQSYGGIDKEKPILIVFEANEKSLLAEGDQGRGKSSVLNAIKACLSYNLAPNAVNNKDNLILTGAEFIGKDGNHYRSKVRSKTLTVEQLVVDEDGNPKLGKNNKPMLMEAKSPATLLRSIVGPLGESPMVLKEKKPSEHIEWIQRYYSQGADEFKEKEAELIKAYKEPYLKRRDIKRDLDVLDAQIKNNEYEVNKDEWIEKFELIGQKETLESKRSESQKLADDYNRALLGLENLKTQPPILLSEIKNIDEEISRLQKRLSEKNKELEVVTKRIESGEKFLNENKTAAEDYNKIIDQIAEIEKLEIHKNNYDALQLMIDNRDRKAKDVTELTKKYEDGLKAVEEFTKSFTPEIKGLEIKIGDEPAVIWNGRNIYELSESELWELALQIWDKFSVSVVFIENIGSLGTNAIERLQWFNQNGGYVFASQMNREEKNLKITINTEIK